jgi:anti-sigma-K factor RskA
VATGREAVDVRLEEPPARVWHGIEATLAGDQQGPAPVPARRTGRRRTALMLAAMLAGVAAGVGGTLAIQQLSDTEPSDTVVATATLEPLPPWDAFGSAEVVALSNGSRELRVGLDVNDAEEDGFREVWLIDTSVSRMVSLGVLDSDSGSLPIPPGVDLAAYPIVDVSLEPYDGQPTHSGDSIVRGSLA